MFHLPRQGSPDWVSCCIYSRKAFLRLRIHTWVGTYVCVTASVRACWVVRKETFPEDAVKGREHTAVSPPCFALRLQDVLTAMGRGWGLCCGAVLALHPFSGAERIITTMGAKSCTLQAGSLKTSCLNLLKLVQVASPCASGLRSTQSSPAVLLGLILWLHPHPGSGYHSQGN